jgi:hypothetical protein
MSLNHLHSMAFRSWTGSFVRLGTICAHANYLILEPLDWSYLSSGFQTESRRSRVYQNTKSTKLFRLHQGPFDRISAGGLERVHCRRTNTLENWCMLFLSRLNRQQQHVFKGYVLAFGLESPNFPNFDHTMLGEPCRSFRFKSVLRGYPQFWQSSYVATFQLESVANTSMQQPLHHV